MQDSDDMRAIRQLVGEHFDALRWGPAERADWERFCFDFIPEASLFPAARPVQRRTLHAFIDRMNGLASATLKSFEEKTLGMQVLLLSLIHI